MVWVRQPLQIIWSRFTAVAGTDLCRCRGDKTCDLITKICTIFTCEMFNDSSSGEQLSCL